MSSQTIIVFGDSITLGAWDSEGGWVSRLWAKTFEIEPTLIYNLGVDGDTSRELSSRFSREICARAETESNNNIVIFAVGINDSSRLDGKNRVSLDNFGFLMRRCIKDAKKFWTKKIFWLGLTPINETITTPVRWDNRLSFTDADRRKYDYEIHRLCTTQHIDYIDLNSYQITLSKDGVHPDSSGHGTIAETVYQSIMKPKSTPAPPPLE